MAWDAEIYYPSGPAFSSRIPTLLGPVELRLDESLFCGMQMDGAFVPYRMTWEWTIPADEPRLHLPRRDEPDRTLFERTVALLLGID